MKKLFTLAAAVLASVSLMAVVPVATLNPASVPADGLGRQVCSCLH